MASEFHELIRQRKRQANSLSSSVDRKKLKTEVLSFLEDNQSFQGILSEAYDTEEQRLRDNELLVGDVTSYSFVSDCIYMLNSQAKRASCSLDLLAAESLSKKLCEEIGAGNHGDYNQFLNKKQKAVLSTIMQIIKILLSQNSFNRIHFAKCLSTNGQSLPLEVLWTLHTQHITSFNTYLACCSYNSASCDTLIRGLISVCNQSLSTEHDLQIGLLTVIFGVLIPLAHKERANNEKRTNLEKVSEDIIQKVVDGNSFISTSSDTGNDTESSRLDVYEVVRNIQEIPQQTLVRFFADQMHKLLFKVPGNTNLSYAVMNQNNWTFSSLPEHKRKQYQQFLYMFKPKVVLDQLSQALSRKEVNWATTLSFLAVFLVCEEEAAMLIKEYTDSLLDEVLSSCDSHSMAVLLLVLRQAALEGAQVFSSYLIWFKSKFGDVSSSPLNNKKTVQFFFQFLTDLVPYEPAYYLKVHVIKSPQVHAKLRSFVQDYSALARTRLMDLKEPLELVGDYNHENSEENSEQMKQQEQAKKEVEKVLDSYKKTGKVPGSVMEASIFRKPYFIGRFLPLLLTPQKLTEAPDIKSKLIRALGKAGKIPSNMLDAYHKACEKMALDQSDISSGDDTAVSDLDRLNKNLKSLTTDILTFMKHSDKTSKSRVSAKLSVLSGLIKTILKTDSLSSSIPLSTPVIIDVDSPALDVKSIQIIDALLNTFCRTSVAARTLDCNDNLRFKWSRDFAAMIASIPVIHTALYCRLWDLLCSKGALSLKLQHIQGIAAFLCHLSSHQHQMTPALLTNADKGMQILCPDHHDKNLSFLELIFSIVPFTSCQWMEFNIRLSSAYLQHAAIAFTNTIPSSLDNNNEAVTNSTCVVPCSLIKKLWYLMHRFSFAALSRHENISIVDTIETVNTVKTSSLYRSLDAATSKVSLEDWLTWEASIDRDKDIFSAIDRHHYHNFAVLGHFVPLDEVDGGCRSSYRTACTTILDTVLDCKSARKSGNHLSIGDLVHLLESIIHLLPQQPDKPHPLGGPRHSWLLGHYYRRVEKITNEAEAIASTLHSILLENETRAFIELVVQLPPYLVFCDTPHRPTPDISPVVEFINDSLRVHSNISCCLSLNVTTHLLKGLMALSRSENSPDISTSIFKTFCKQCPLFFVSIQYYWEHVTITMSCFGGNQAMSTVFCDAEALYKWMSSLYTDSPVSMATPLAYPSWIIASCLFSGLRTSQNPVHHVQKLCTRMDTTFMTKLAVCLFACILSSFTETVLQGHKISDKRQLWTIAMELVKSFPDVVVAFVDDKHRPYAEDLHQLRTLLLPNKYGSLLPVVFFSLFTECGHSVIQKVKMFPEFPKITLTMNQKFTHLRKMCLENQAYRSCEKPFQLDFAKKVLQFLSQHAHL